MNISAYFQERRTIVDNALCSMLPASDQYPHVIHQAMYHSLFAGGKRLRPILALAAYEAIECSYRKILPTACALECIHTYSLIHDDLPAMDDDDFRRGVPTCHKVYGEAIAILAGDALLTHAFYLLAENAKIEGISVERVVKVIAEIANACGTNGLIGGQVVDLTSEDKQVDADTLRYIHQKKTGALITASVRAGAILAGASVRQLEAMTGYGDCLGLAFQITDDILDIEGSIEALGKTPGSDAKKHKATYPALFGMQEAKKQAEIAVQKAKNCIEVLGERGEVLSSIADFVLYRNS